MWVSIFNLRRELRSANSEPSGEFQINATANATLCLLMSVCLSARNETDRGTQDSGRKKLS